MPHTFSASWKENVQTWNREAKLTQREPAVTAPSVLQYIIHKSTHTTSPIVTLRHTVTFHHCSTFSFYRDWDCDCDCDLPFSFFFFVFQISSEHGYLSSDISLKSTILYNCDTTSRVLFESSPQDCLSLVTSGPNRKVQSLVQISSESKPIPVFFFNSSF